MSVKQWMGLMAICTLVQLVACDSGSRTRARQTAAALQDAANSGGPSYVATSQDGYTMRAVIQGKPWTAKTMIAFDAVNDHRVYGSDGTTKIAFNLDLNHLHAGITRNFGELFAADLITSDAIGAWGGRKGKVVVTRYDERVIEGTFHFIATTHTDPDKHQEVTNGFFRILRTP